MNSEAAAIETVIAARGSRLAARVTTTSTSTNAALPTVVPLASADPLTGHVLVDDLVQLYHDELTKAAGAVSGATMTAVSVALRSALP